MAWRKKELDFQKKIMYINRVKHAIFLSNPIESTTPNQ
jgi:hypothetical protein